MFSGAQVRHKYVLAGSGGIGAEPPMLWLAREAPETALCAAVTATAALWWPDEMVGKAANFCRCHFPTCLVPSKKEAALYMSQLMAHLSSVDYTGCC